VGLQVEVGVEIAGSVETKALSWYLWLVWLERCYSLSMRNC
jgi:hypothetical protein